MSVRTPVRPPSRADSFFSAVKKTAYRWEGRDTKFTTSATLEGTAAFFVLIFLLLDGMLKWRFARTAGKKHRAVRAPSKKKTKNEVKKTKNLKILLSGICCGAGFSQCTFGHSQIRLQTSGHECLLPQIPENWITFRKSLEIESKTNSFC